MEEEKNTEVSSFVSRFEDNDCYCTFWQPVKRIRLYNEKSVRRLRKPSAGTPKTMSSLTRAKMSILHPSREKHIGKFYLRIRDFHIRNNSSILFKIKNAYVGETILPSINWKPNDFSSLLVSLNDLVQYLVPKTTPEQCEEVLRLHNVYFYLPNLEMRKVLLEGKKILKVEQMIPLVQVFDVINNILQLKFINDVIQ